MHIQLLQSSLPGHKRVRVVKRLGEKNVALHECAYPNWIADVLLAHQKFAVKIFKAQKGSEWP